MTMGTMGSRLIVSRLGGNEHRPEHGVLIGLSGGLAVVAWRWDRISFIPVEDIRIESVDGEWPLSEKLDTFWAGHP